MPRCAATTATAKRCKHVAVNEFCAGHQKAGNAILYRSLDIWPSNALMIAYRNDKDGMRASEFAAFEAAYGAAIAAAYGDHSANTRIEYIRYRHMGLGEFNIFHTKKYAPFRAMIDKRKLQDLINITRNFDSTTCLMCGVPMSVENFKETEGYCSYKCMSGGGY